MTRVVYNWKDCDVGRRGLCEILAYALSKATEAQLLIAPPHDYGISAEGMRAWVVERVPQLEADHLGKTGQPLTGKKMMSRLHNMYDVLPSGQRTPSGEHPTRHADLTATWLRVSGQQTDMFQETEGDKPA